MHLLVGLGNIGSEYEKTRHNFGFLLLDQIILDYHLKNISKKFHSEIFSGEIDSKKVISIKPQTFMNRSGIAVLEVANFYKIPLKNIIVLHDDVDLAFAKLKVKTGGGSGGHNGLKSIDEMVGKNYMRLRLGLGRPENSAIETADYVLQNFTKEEFKMLEKLNAKISSLLPHLMNDEADKFLNKFYM
ncbi:MAG: aminoacyl-tRNA hydrolase [Rickettsiales bacterium]|nr:aminoacyl-tRNA hydrolase [Rickettsiales bacterium]